MFNIMKIQRVFGLSMDKAVTIIPYGNLYKVKIQDGVQLEKRRQKLNLKTEIFMCIIPRTKMVNIKIRELRFGWMGMIQ